MSNLQLGEMIGWLVVVLMFIGALYGTFIATARTCSRVKVVATQIKRNAIDHEYRI